MESDPRPHTLGLGHSVPQQQRKTESTFPTLPAFVIRRMVTLTAALRLGTDSLEATDLGPAKNCSVSQVHFIHGQSILKSQVVSPNRVITCLIYFECTITKSTIQRWDEQIRSFNMSVKMWPQTVRVQLMQLWELKWGGAGGQFSGMLVTLSQLFRTCKYLYEPVLNLNT